MRKLPIGEVTRVRLDKRPRGVGFIPGGQNNGAQHQGLSINHVLTFCKECSRSIVKMFHRIAVSSAATYRGRRGRARSSIPRKNWRRQPEPRVEAKVKA